MQMNHYTNKKSLALLGHSKLKGALRHTLLIIGMVLMSLGAFAQTPTNGLYLHKDWQPDDTDPTGSKGYIRLETFVTGEKIITETHTPTDIVLVLDVSGSMNDYIYEYEYTARNSQAYSYYGYGNNTYYYLHTDGNYYAVSRITQNRYRRLRFQVNGTYWYLSGTTATTTAPTNVTSEYTTIWTGVLYTRTTVSQQRKLAALKTAVKAFVDKIAEDAEEFEVDHRISIVKYAGNRFYGANQSTADPATSTGASDVTEGNHMYQNNGYNYTEVVVNRRNAQNDATWIKNQVDALQQGGATSADFGMYKAQYVLAGIPADEMETRSKVVVMFTDGEPNHQSGFDDDVANRVIQYAYNMKHSWTNGNNTYQFDAKVFTIGVFGTNINENTPTYMDRTSSNYPQATSMTNTCVKEDDGYFALAESADALNDIFDAIAQESGASAMPMGIGTIVQDVISPSFQLNLPDGVNPNTIIKAYAPKCNGKNGTMFTFEDEIDGASRLVMGTDDAGNEGVVIGGNENRLPDGIVNYDAATKTITFTNFNFEKMYVAQEMNNDDTPYVDPETGEFVFTGRKLVMLIPLEIGDGSWGDGIETNGPMSVIYPNGDMSNPIYFNRPTANVLGSVWTEVIVQKPEGFDANNIDSPEDLAWFISEVNGRHGYTHNNTVASHPKLNGRLTADIDMSAHNWVPIGCGNQVETYVEDGVTKTRYIENNGQRVHMVYEGTFDGNGHVVTGLKNNASKYYKLIEGDEKNVVVFPGMFSDVSGTIKNLFVLDADFRGKHHNEHFVHHGIIADTLEASGNIFNCEAAGRITCNNDDVANDSQLIYGGLVGLNNGGTIHSCMAMAELTAYTMGGMIGENRGSFSNGFTNGVYKYLDNGATDKYVGGIAGINSGTIDNCYVRFERLTNTNLDKLGNNFDMICGNNTGGDDAVSNTYIPQIVTFSRPNYASVTTAINTNSSIPNQPVAPGDNPTNSYTLTVSPSFFNMFTNDNMTGGTWGTLGSFNVYNNGTPLVDKLNNGKGDGASWKRTTAGNYSNDAGNINGDFPVLQFDQFTCLGSADGIRIDYAASLKDMLHRHNNGNMNENTNISNEYTAQNANYYKVTEHEAIYKGTINLYANDDVTLESTGGKDGVADNCTADGVVVYIDENISLLQDVTSEIEAYTGQTLASYVPNGKERWHFVSSSLEDSQFGWTYLEEEQVEHNWEADPCGWNLNNHDEDYAFYPIDISSYNRADFYCFYEPQYHWINFRRNSLSHWHMEKPEVNISYTNETAFTPGKGYLTAVEAEYWSSYNKTSQFMQNRGTLNNGNVAIDVTCSETAVYDENGYKTGLEGYNLLGNPYQSYLDFTTFAWNNSDLWSDASEMTYAVYDPQTGDYVQGTAGEQPSTGALAATGDINMHQGFMIRATAAGTATFTNDMRSNTPASGTHFRGEKLNYPLVNLILTDAEGKRDIAVLEVGRPENGGGQKLRTSSAKGHISLRHDDKNFGILFRDMNQGSQPLYFDAEEDGTFTLSWNTANANFQSLTLVDNIAGVKYDMLANDSYTFQGSVSDYRSRFKVVFGAFTDVEENEEVVTDNFAFFDGSDWIVNGQGQLTVTDMTGRTVYSSNLTNDQNRVSLNGVANGIYLMRVANGQNVNVQKIIIK